MKCFFSCAFFKFLNRGSKVLLITKLPRYADDCYTEKEVAEVLMPFGFNYTNENIYIVPQREMVGTRADVCGL